MDNSRKISVLERAVEDLQSRLAFQEDTIEQLNQALTSQDQELLKLARKQQKLDELLERLEADGDTGKMPSLADEVPPHY